MRTKLTHGSGSQWTVWGPPHFSSIGSNALQDIAILIRLLKCDEALLQRCRSFRFNLIASLDRRGVAAKRLLALSVGRVDRVHVLSEENFVYDSNGMVVLSISTCFRMLIDCCSYRELESSSQIVVGTSSGHIVLTCGRLDLLVPASTPRSRPRAFRFTHCMGLCKGTSQGRPLPAIVQKKLDVQRQAFIRTSN